MRLIFYIASLAAIFGLVLFIIRLPVAWLAKKAFPKQFPRWTVIGGCAATVGNFLACLVWVVTLLSMSPEGHGRFLVQAGMVGIISLITLVIAFPSACIAAFAEKRWILGLLIMCMAFTPFFISRFTLHKVAAMRHITLDD